MIVYGDPQFAVTAPVLLKRLQYRLARTDPRSLSDLRTFLIQAGQFEQAWADCEYEARCDFIAASQQITGHAAAAFHARWCEDGRAAASAFARMRQHVERLSATGGVPLTVKIPEGFEFYALYPEQYILAAQEWMRQRTGATVGKIMVLGLRSIGTTLSAIVAASLKSKGWKVQRVTVRPTGPAFSRRVQLPEDLSRPDWAIIVDEGPGLSGSSFAAAAAALVGGGMDARRISFFPGHAGDPGAEAISSVRHWWKTIQRIASPLELVRWNGITLQERLRRQTSELLSSSSDTVIENLSGGEWRKLIARGRIPATAIPFERLKYCGTNGSGRGVFWKFAGLGAMLADGETQAEHALEQLNRRAAIGWTPRPLGSHQGFIASPWIAGRPLSLADTRNGFVERCGRYIACMAGSPLPSEVQRQGVERLAEMLVHNATEALGKSACEQAKVLRRRIKSRADFPACGDGRMAPAHWLRARDGKLFKTSGAVPVDHTIVGSQAVLWDFAGAIMEWNFAAAQRNRLIRSACSTGIRFDIPALGFYEAAYAAFQMGQMSLCEVIQSTPEETRRVQRAIRRWREKLRETLRA